MIRGLPASLLLHAGVLGLSVVALPRFAPERIESVIVPVELVEIGAVNNIAPVVRREPEPEPEPEEIVPEPNLEDYLENVDTLPEDAPAEPEEAPPEAAEQAPPPPVEEDTVPVEPEEDDPPEPEPEPEPVPKKEPPKIVPPERDALDEILNSENLFNRARTETRTPPPPTPPVDRPVTSSEPRQGAGDRTGNTARIESIVLAQMKICWEDTDDLPDPERLTVSIRIFLKPDGTIQGRPEFVSPRRAPIGDRYMQVAMDRAMRAANSCQPYRLPADDYEDWRELILNFRAGT